MKTLADLKRDLKVGDQIMMTFNAMDGSSERINAMMNIPRYIIKKNTQGLVLNADKDAIKGSTLTYPAKASLCEYNGDTLKIYDAGYRELTPEEQTIKDNVPSRRPENKEAVGIELMTDGSGFFWKDKAYYKEHNAEYLRGYETIRGLYYTNGKLRDESIRGELSLAYKIIK